MNIAYDSQFTSILPTVISIIIMDLLIRYSFLVAAITHDHEEGHLVISFRFTYSRRNLGVLEEQTTVKSVWQGTTRAACARK